MKLGAPPQLLTNLYQDLRDRHLLIPVLGLLAAMVAVPFLLKSHAEPQALAPVPPTSDSASAIEPAVLADQQVNVRDYRKRLADLKTKNPFDQQFAVDDTATGSGGGSGSSTGAGTSSTGVSSVSSTTPSTGATTPPTTATTTPSGTPSTGTPGGSAGSSNNPSRRDVRVVHELFTRHINVMVGVQGDTKLHQDVKPMTILPDAQTPVLAFLGTDEGGKRAAFVVSSDVTAVGGDGACVPDPTNCLYITLQKGEKAMLDYAPDGQTYELKLLAIRDVKLRSD